MSKKEEMCDLLHKYFGSDFTTEKFVNELQEVKCFN